MSFKLLAKFFFIFLIFIQTVNADWRKIESKTLSWLYSIDFADDKNGFIGGSNGTFLLTTDSGASWREQKKFTNDTIREIYFTDTNNGWLLCERDTFNLGGSAPSYLLKTTNGGKTFERVEFESERRERIADIFFTKQGIGFAIGESGAIFALREDRLVWKKQSAPVRYLLVGGIFQNDTDGVIVGGGGNVLFTEDSGYTWKNASLAGSPKSRFNSVFFLDEKTGWAVGTDGKIFQTINGGKFWRNQKSGVQADLTDVAFLDTREGYAVGDNGLLLSSNTAGNVWSAINSKTTHRLEKIYFNGSKGWAIGYGGTILSYQKSSNFDNRRPRLNVK